MRSSLDSRQLFLAVFESRFSDLVRLVSGVEERSGLDEGSRFLRQ